MLYLEKIDVESYCGHDANASPRAFTLGGTRHVVRELLLRHGHSADERRLCVQFHYSEN